MDVPHSGMNATVDGTIGAHGERVTESVMANTVVHEALFIQVTKGVMTDSTHALHRARDGPTRDVMHFVIMEEHQMATNVDVLQDFLEHAVDFVRICQTLYDNLQFFNGL